jgi:hypothetical protein
LSSASPTWDEVRAHRLARSRLDERAPAAQLVEVVRDLCGLHAQVLGSAELQLAARVEGITQAETREALWERRTIAKTWTTRGTLHIHPADELALWTAARRAVEEPGNAELVTAIGDALRGRPPLTREQLAAAVVERVPSAPYEELMSGWGFHVSDAATAGALCFGPPQGAKVTFVHVEDWLGPQPAWEPDEALREVARRYATTYAPAGRTQLREWLAAKVDVAVPEVLLAPGGGSVRLLPEYDPYVMGFRERDHLVPPEVRAQVAAHGKGRYEGPAATPFLVVDGLAVGLWRRRRTARRIELTVEPARKLAAAERRGVEDEAARIGAFLGLEPQLTIVR